MPGYKVHTIGGGLVYIIGMVLTTAYFITKPSIIDALIWFFCAILGSLFPDVDIKSKGQILFYEVLAIVLLIVWFRKEYLLFTYITFLGLLPVLNHHRGLFHQAWFLIGISALAAHGAASCYPYYKYSLQAAAFFFCIGALSHIGLDFFVTKMKRKGF